MGNRRTKSSDGAFLVNPRRVVRGGVASRLVCQPPVALR